MPRGSSLVDWRYDEAAVQRRLWTPAQLPASFLSVWYDFSAIGSLTLDGSSKISQVNDLSGNGDFATQVTAGNRPTIIPTGKVNVTGRQYADATAGASFMTLNSSLAYTAGNGISVAVAANITGSAFVSVCGGNAGSLELRVGSGNVIELLNRGVVVLVTSSNSTLTGGMCVLGCEAQTNLSAVWLDGVRTANASNPNYSQPLTNIFDSVGDAFTGGIGEFLFFNGNILTTRQRNLVDGYLAWKWGSVQKLTASHPFLTRPPLIGD